jgi:ubiquinone/menaquinone biosynthesis C-methylase UbiE
MFFANKPQAFAEFTRVLKPGGKLVFTVWDSYANNPVAQIAQETIESFFDTNAPQFLRVPWGFSEIEPIKTLVDDAGLVDLDIEVVSKTIERPDVYDVARGFVEGNPTILAIREDALVNPEEVIDAVAGNLKAVYGETNLKIPLQEIYLAALKA